MSAFEKICVVGLGYIGLPSATVFADHGVEVVGVDIDPAVIDSINDGRPHIVEPELDERLMKVVRAGKLRATLEPESSQAVIIAVPTPFTGDHQPDLSYVEAAAKAIAPVLKSGDLVVLESTSPVGATEQLSRWLARERSDLTFPHEAGESSDILVAHCPERVLPGKILREVVENDRIIGGITGRCAERAMALYKVFVTGRIRLTSARLAEMTKLTENAFRDVNIAFANELSLIADAQGIDVWELIELANLHPRVNILQPGPGVGGHCIAVDPWFIIAADPANSRLIRAARAVNDSKPSFVVEKVSRAAAAHEDPVIACLGLAYKADVDDLRESPAIGIVEALAEAKVGELLVVEPHVDHISARLAGRGVKLCELDEAMRRADIVVLLVDHKLFRDMDRKPLDGRTVIDTRGIW